MCSLLLPALFVFISGDALLPNKGVGDFEGDPGPGDVPTGILCAHINVMLIADRMDGTSVGKSPW
eukprot:11258296-Prorocentrum_lima.AAC.1